MKKAAFLFLLATATTACSKSSDSQDPAAKQLYPTKVVYIQNQDTDYPTTYQYEYDSQNRLSKSTRVEIGDTYNPTTISTYTYTNDRLSEIAAEYTSTTTSTDWYKLEYVNNLLSTVSLYNGNETEPADIVSLIYANGNTQPKIISTNSGEKGDTLTYDNLGNIVRISGNYGAGNTGETSISYDTQHRYFTWCIPNPYDLEEQYSYCPLQMTKVYKTNGQTTGTDTTTFSYVFNADGYPTKVTITTISVEPGYDNSTIVDTYDITYK